MSYTITIDSLNGSGNDANKTFTIDWSFLTDNQEYDMTFSYRSTQPAKYLDILDPSIGKGGELYIKLPQLLMDYAYETGSSGSGTSDIIGMVRPSINITPPNNGSSFDVEGDYLQYETPNNFNAPIRCKKPTGSSFQVKILSVGVSETGTYFPSSRQDASANAQAYVMILHFKAVPKF